MGAQSAADKSPKCGKQMNETPASHKNADGVTLLWTSLFCEGPHFLDFVQVRPQVT